MTRFQFVSIVSLMTIFQACSVNAISVPISIYGPWKLQGCFADGSPRTLHHQLGSFSSRTVFNCLDLCASGGFALGGLEYGSECYCGNAQLYNYGPSNACNMPCPGDTSSLCGGPNAIEIYSIGTPYTVGPASEVTSYNGWRLTECWQDDLWSSGGPRLLPHWPSTSIPAEQMTVAKCINGCAASGFTSAGLEYGQECWCGNVSYPPGQSDPPMECNMPCLGDATEYCGGPSRILVYTSLPAP